MYIRSHRIPSPPIPPPQVIGVVVADTEAIARRAAKLVVVEYEDLPAVMSCEEVRAGSTWVREGLRLCCHSLHPHSSPSLTSDWDTPPAPPLPSPPPAGSPNPCTSPTPVPFAPSPQAIEAGQFYDEYEHTMTSGDVGACFASGECDHVIEGTYKVWGRV